MFDWRSLLGRFIAAGLSVLALWITDKTGVPITAEEVEGASAVLTIWGGGQLLLGYSAAHKLINSKLSPSDGAVKTTEAMDGTVKIEHKR